MQALMISNYLFHFIRAEGLKRNQLINLSSDGRGGGSTFLKSYLYRQLYKFSGASKGIYQALSHPCKSGYIFPCKKKKKTTSELRVKNPIKVGLSNNVFIVYLGVESFKF